jgi:hypothetical protein
MARRRAADGIEAGTDFDAAIAALRRVGNPHQTAHGLLDHAAYLFHRGETDQAIALVDEARETADRLRAEPLLLRAEEISATAAESGAVAER